MASVVSEALQAVEYPRFAAEMDKFGYDWEAVKVHTDDHYILTTFHVKGKSGKAQNQASKGSVLIQHGDMEDGAYWLS